MNALPSTEFRKTFAKLTEVTAVTVNGHLIGRWVPLAQAFRDAAKAAPEADPEIRVEGLDDYIIVDRMDTMAEARKAQQDERDRILRGVNRKS